MVRDERSEIDKKIVKGIKKKVIIVLVTILVFIVCTLLFLFYHFFYSMNALPQGQLIKTINSPNHLYEMNIYVTNGGATTDFSVRGEIEDLKTKRKWNVYWNYHEENAIGYWINNSVVEINNHKLNIYKDKYDFRREN